MDFLPAIEREGLATAQTWCLAFFEGRLLLPEPEEALLEPLPAWVVDGWPGTRHYLGQLGGLDCLTFETPELPAGFRPVALRAAMMQFPQPLVELASRAAQVLEWDRAHRFCGACGTPTEAVPRERARRCPACSRVAYPRVSPSMMVLIHRPGELLLARGPHFVPGMYSALAGFVEAGESIEQCVHREAFEEVGVRVGALRYFGSQSWPFPHSLMIAYTAEWAGGEIVPQEGEIEDAQWFPVDALPRVPPRFSIAGHLIRDTVAAMRDGAGPRGA